MMGPRGVEVDAFFHERALLFFFWFLFFLFEGTPHCIPA